MNIQEIQALCLELMHTSEAAYLTTIDPHGFPDTRAMLNLRNITQFPTLQSFFTQHGQNLSIFFSTNTSSYKLQELAQNPKASVYFCLPKVFKGVMLSGVLEPITDLAIKRALWQDDWTRYYPGGLHDPDNSVLRLVPQMLKGWANMERFQLHAEEMS